MAKVKRFAGPRCNVSLIILSTHDARMIVFILTLLSSGLVGGVRKTQLTWVNGIAYTLEHMEEGKCAISRLFGGKEVLYCHNPTAMSSESDQIGYLTDLTQAGTQKLGRATEEVAALVNHLKQAVAAVGKKGRVIHIAHSQGALLTSLAAKELSPLEMSQIEVIAFGGAAALRTSSATPWKRVINYYSINDPLLLVVPPAAQALRQGYFSHSPEQQEFCFLAPREGDPIRDHNLLGRTYSQALYWEGQRFQREYQSLAYRASRPVWINTTTGAVIIVFAFQRLIHTALRLFLFPIVYLLRLLFAKAIEPSVRWIAKVLLPPLIALLKIILKQLHETIRVLRREERYIPIEVAMDVLTKSPKEKNKLSPK